MLVHQLGRAVDRGRHAGLVAAVYLGLWLGLAAVASVFQASQQVSLWYPPTGLTFALLLVFGLRYVPVLLLTDVLAKVVGITPDASWVDVGVRAVWTTAVYSACVAVLLRRTRMDPRLPTQRDVLWFLGLACGAGPLLVALGQVVQYDLSGLLRWRDVASDVLGFWSGSATGVAVLTPALLVGARRVPGLFHRREPLPPVTPRPAPTPVESAGQLAVLLTTVALAYGRWFGAGLDLTYLVYVPVIWIAVRGGFPRTVVAVLVLNVATVALVGRRVSDDPLRLQLGLVTITLAAVLLGALVTQRQSDAARAARAALRDPLTGLVNRTVLQDRLTAAVHRVHRRPTSLAAVLFCDVDGFKAVNDGLGHDAGDQLLVSIAGRIERTVRPTDTVARLGGDEIVILLEDIADPAEAAEIADRIIAAFRAPSAAGDQEVDITLSIGVAVVEPAATVAETGSAPGSATGSVALTPPRLTDGTARARAEDLVRSADAALQQAKRQGGDRLAVFSQPLRDHTRQRLERRVALRRALASHDIQVAYQPVVRLADDRVVTREALARWSEPPGSPVPPVDFIAIAEETGLIHDLGAQVFEQACTDLARWRAGGEPDMRVAVNVSPRQLLAESFPSTVLDALARHGLPPASVDLEITESSAMGRAGPTRTALRTLVAAGMSLVIDDFGTGYSSFAALRDTAPARLKIDRSFVSGLPDDEASAGLVQAITTMAAHLGVEVTAEGVETPAQLSLVTELGCGCAQGYLLGRPLLEDERAGA